MAQTGILGKADLTKDSDIAVWTNAASTVTTTNIYFCNRNVTKTKVRLAITTAAAPAAADYKEYDAVLGTGSEGVLERTGIPVGPSEKVFARASTNNVSVQVRGFSESNDL